MYDPQTAALIRQTPELPGLDSENLPDALSRAYAEIASARVMLRGDAPTLEKLIDTINFAKRLARTN